MGLFKKLRNSFGLGKSKVNIIVVGLDNSGKTTLINKLRPKKSQSYEVAPTVGFAMDEFSKNNLKFSVFDMSGQSKYRSLWENYYHEVHAIIFVIDSTDKIRMCVAKDELQQMLNHEDLAKNKQIPLLLFANKMDLSSALTPAECMQQLELDQITEKPFHIAASNAISGDGIDKGIDWLANKLSKPRNTLLDFSVAQFDVGQMASVITVLQNLKYEPKMKDTILELLDAACNAHQGTWHVYFKIRKNCIRFLFHAYGMYDEEEKLKCMECFLPWLEHDDVYVVLETVKGLCMLFKNKIKLPQDLVYKIWTWSLKNALSGLYSNVRIVCLELLAQMDRAYGQEYNNVECAVIGVSHHDVAFMTVCAAAADMDDRVRFAAIQAAVQIENVSEKCMLHVVSKSEFEMSMNNQHQIWQEELNVGCTNAVLLTSCGVLLTLLEDPCEKVRKRMAKSIGKLITKEEYAIKIAIREVVAHAVGNVQAEMLEAAVELAKSLRQYTLYCMTIDEFKYVYARGRKYHTSRSWEALCALSANCEFDSTTTLTAATHCLLLPRKDFYSKEQWNSILQSFASTGGNKLQNALLGPEFTEDCDAIDANFRKYMLDSADERKRKIVDAETSLKENIVHQVQHNSIDTKKLMAYSFNPCLHTMEMALIQVVAQLMTLQNMPLDSCKLQNDHYHAKSILEQYIPQLLAICQGISLEYQHQLLMVQQALQALEALSLENITKARQLMVGMLANPDFEILHDSLPDDHLPDTANELGKLCHQIINLISMSKLIQNLPTLSIQSGTITFTTKNSLESPKIVVAKWPFQIEMKIHLEHISKPIYLKQYFSDAPNAPFELYTLYPSSNFTKSIAVTVPRMYDIATLYFQLVLDPTTPISSPVPYHLRSITVKKKTKK